MWSFYETLKSQWLSKLAIQASMFPWLKRTPFGGPVVPLVQEKVQMSSWTGLISSKFISLPSPYLISSPQEMSSRFICLIFSLVYYCSSSKVIKVFNLPKSFRVSRVFTVTAETKRVVISVWLRQYEMFSTPKVSYRGTVVMPVNAHAQSVTNHSYLFFEYIPTSFMARTASTRYKFR